MMRTLSMASLSLLAVATLSVACSNESTTGEGAQVLNAQAAGHENLGSDAITQCHGTEPFWGLSISPEKIAFEDASGLGQNMTMKNAGVKAATGTTSAYIALYQGRTLEDSSKFMNVIIKNESCNNGMSDELFSHSVLVMSGSTLFHGCCSK